MILSGKISKENASKLGYQSPFSFRIIAGLVDSKKQKGQKDVVLSIITDCNGRHNEMNTVLPDNMVDELFFDIFGEQEMKEVQSIGNSCHLEGE